MSAVPDQQFVEPPMVLNVVLPPEPPNGSVVLAGGPAGHAWQRYDGLWDHKPPRAARWIPTVGWWDPVTEETRRTPLTWPQFIAQASEIHILRWGDGKPPKEEGQ
jgi:hypothetical protein